LKGQPFLLLVPLLLLVLPSPGYASTDALNITVSTTLTEDHAGEIIIAADDITLDCAGHTISGTFSGPGVSLEGRTGVTIQNCAITRFLSGIRLRASTDIMIISNVMTQNTDGIGVFLSHENTIMNNLASDNGIAFYLSGSERNRLTSNLSGGDGIGYFLDSSNHNIVNRNEARFDTNGYKLVSSNGNLLADNKAENNNTNYLLQFSDANTLGENTASGPFAGDGFHIFASHNNILNENTARDSMFSGYRLIGSNGNKIAGNIADNNKDGFSIEANSSSNEVILNLISANDHGIHICKSIFKQNDIIPNSFSGPQQAIAIDKTC